MGMAGTGKSHWSKKLAEYGFTRFCCDDLISEKLGSELRRADGTTLNLGEWMGFPYEPHYAERESKYLACERDVLTEILAHLRSLPEDREENLVVDTTGSVIYSGPQILKELKELTVVVYLPVPREVGERMFRAYLSEPGPVLWMGLFRQEADETREEALARCYRKLLHSRERLYEKYAEVMVGYHERRREEFSVKDFLNRIGHERRV